MHKRKGVYEMTRKDYVKFAWMLKELNIDYGPTDHDLIAAFAIRTANILAEDNPNFDRSRFLTACGVEGNNNPVKKQTTFGDIREDKFNETGIES
jgi:hypothetical protein